MDVVPRIGGRWGHCAGADANLAFSGYRRDREGRLYSHRRPAPMLYEAPAEETCSLFQAASAWLEGRLRADRRGARSATCPVRPTSPVGKEAG